MVANAYGTINALSIAGKRANGQPWVMFSFYGGGHGGTPEGDGLNHGNAPISTATIPPMEILEAAYPVMFTQWALRPDSAGAGAHRGGLGAVYEIEVLEGNGAEAFLFGERGRFAPQGVAGGAEAAMNVFCLRAGRWLAPVRRWLRRCAAFAWRRGRDRVGLETPGGGGYGAARQAAARHADRARRGPGTCCRRRRGNRSNTARAWQEVHTDVSKRQHMIGVDVGGTFTDVFVLDEAKRRSAGRQGAHHPPRPVGRVSRRDQASR